jgi:hypothetical protein
VGESIALSSVNINKSGKINMPVYEIVDENGVSADPYAYPVFEDAEVAAKGYEKSDGKVFSVRQIEPICNA